MSMQQNHTDEASLLHHLKHYLPSQAPLKDFIHHNTLHAFQDMPFHKAMQSASSVFGYRTYLALGKFRKMYADGTIPEAVLNHYLEKNKGEDWKLWKNKLLTQEMDENLYATVGQLREYWQKSMRVKMDKTVQTNLFRIISSYLDQGISIWNFPAHELGLAASVRKLEERTAVSFFQSERVKKLMRDENVSWYQLLNLLVGREDLYETYLFDQQFTHPGWSGMVAFLEDNPNALFDKKTISLSDFIWLELLLEMDYLDTHLGDDWRPMGMQIGFKPEPLFGELEYDSLFELYSLWQEIYEWSFYHEALNGIQTAGKIGRDKEQKTFQAITCMDDRESSFRRYIEEFDPKAETFGTPGFFNAEFYYQPVGSKFYSKLCPAPAFPKHLIKELGTEKKREKELHYSQHSHNLFSGWIISQTLGFWSALKLFFNIFNPRMSPAVSSSFRHLDKDAELIIENQNPADIENGLQIGYTIDEMANRAEAMLKSIGFVDNFAPIVYIVGHGATSVNNTYYAGYDCGACSGRPGSVNAKVMSYICNHPKVRAILAERGVQIPDTTIFIPALQDTTRDEITFYDHGLTLSETQKTAHAEHQNTFRKVLDMNAMERSRRFKMLDTSKNVKKVHKDVELRSVSLFEPRPEYNHATNCMAVVGARNLTKGVFLDRRSFLNSYSYEVDTEGKYLTGILGALAPVAGGINLEYYFSRVDNSKLGAGSKLPHNVVGLFAVANGINGDLRPGLPSQMIDIHAPLRLLVVVENASDFVEEVIKRNPATYEWFKNEWVRLVAIDPHSPKDKNMYLWENEAFQPFTPLATPLKVLDNSKELFETHAENLPVYLLKQPAL